MPRRHVDAGRRRLLVAAGALLAGVRPTTAGAAGSVRQVRPVGDFDALRWSISGELQVDQRPQPSLTIEAEAAVLAAIVSEVRDGRLTIAYRPDTRFTTTLPIRVQASCPSLRELVLDGSGRTRLGPRSGTPLRLQMAGNGDVEIDRLEMERLTLDLDGSGHVRIAAGQVGRARLNLAGSGRIEAGRLAAREAEADLSGSGEIELAAAQTLTARLGGSGDIRYRGRPRVVQQITGAGRIRPIVE